MAEEQRTNEHGAAPQVAAMIAALGAESHGEAARAYLRAQTRLALLQAKDLEREDTMRHWSLRFGNVSAVMKVSFEIALAFIFVAIAGLIAAAIWTAAHGDALVIEAFNVPADMAAQGLTGEVIATRVQDRIAYIQSHADTVRAASTFRNDWGTDIKVQIPDTGVSIGEAYRFLSSWLGHETHITGEVWRDGKDIAVAARAGSDPAQVFRGPQSNLDRLVAAAAEYVYGRTQPYRYIVFLDQQGRSAESFAAARVLALEGPPEERPWAYSRLGSNYFDARGDFRQGLAMQQLAARLGPDLGHVAQNLAGDKVFLGHDEAALHDSERSLALFRSRGSARYARYAVAVNLVAEPVILDAMRGDYRDAIARAPAVQSLADYNGAHVSLPIMISNDLALDHDVNASRAADPEYPNEDRFALQPGTAENFSWDLPPLPGVMRAVALDDWPAARAELTMLQGLPSAADPGVRALMPVLTWPWLAYSDARLGRFGAAHALIDKTPRDCYLCVRMRGNIDAAEKNARGADYWFADAVRQAPSIPFAYSNWGAALLRRGDTDGAIAKFAAAHVKGPHFADPLEMWGEALMRKNRSDLALAKFEETNKYAPNWGRLHLKWGEALRYTGNKDEAKNQFAVASHLDLSAADAAKLHNEKSLR
ncbi:MAG: hypothetical protein ACREHV_08340 [Rhizomicrobium sp.]